MRWRRAAVLAVTTGVLLAVTGLAGAVVGAVAVVAEMAGRGRSLARPAGLLAVALLTAAVAAQLLSGSALLVHQLAGAGVAALAVGVVSGLLTVADDPLTPDPDDLDPPDGSECPDEDERSDDLLQPARNRAGHHRAERMRP